MSDLQKTEAEIVAAMAVNGGGSRRVARSELSQYTLVPDGYTLQSLEDYQQGPNRIEAAPKFRNVASLALYLDRFEQDESIAKSRPAANEIRVEIDHHIDKDHAAWLSHTATFVASFTAEYAEWQKVDRKSMNQVQALEFLEERAVDIVAPGPAEVMDMVMNFDALKRVTFKQSTKLQSGERQFVYAEENEVRGQINLPEMIELRLPIYEGMEPDVFKVRVRYRIDDGRLQFSFLINQRPKLELVAFERCEDALKVARPELLILRSY